ncbi:MAG: hypothetical protein ACR2IN_04025 [Thermoleophilaceae bacterium]
MVELDAAAVAFLLGASVVAGAVNAIAGGGLLISFRRCWRSATRA